MMPMIRMPSAVKEVSNDEFVKACVAFQQAKDHLSALMNGADVEACDTVSRAVYNLANKAMTKQQRFPTKRTVGRMPFRDVVIQSVQGQKSFNAQSVIDAMKRRGTTPKLKNVRGALHALFSARKDLFERLDTGTYRLRNHSRGRLQYSKKEVKALPAKSA